MRGTCHTRSVLVRTIREPMVPEPNGADKSSVVAFSHHLSDFLLAPFHFVFVVQTDGSRKGFGDW